MCVYHHHGCFFPAKQGYAIELCAASCISQQNQRCVKLLYVLTTNQNDGPTWQSGMNSRRYFPKCPYSISLMITHNRYCQQDDTMDVLMFGLDCLFEKLFHLKQSNCSLSTDKYAIYIKGDMVYLLHLGARALQLWPRASHKRKQFWACA